MKFCPRSGNQLNSESAECQGVEGEFRLRRKRSRTERYKKPFFSLNARIFSRKGIFRLKLLRVTIGFFLLASDVRENCCLQNGYLSTLRGYVGPCSPAIILLAPFPKIAFYPQRKGSSCRTEKVNLSCRRSFFILEGRICNCNFLRGLGGFPRPFLMKIKKEKEPKFSALAFLSFILLYTSQ